MQGRIRGHYRIDENGRVESLADVNGSAMQFAATPRPPTRKVPRSKQSRITRICAIGLVIAALGVSSMASMPYIQRVVARSQIARIAAARLEVRKAYALRMGHHRDAQWLGNAAR